MESAVQPKRLAIDSEVLVFKFGCVERGKMPVRRHGLAKVADKARIMSQVVYCFGAIFGISLQLPPTFPSKRAELSSKPVKLSGLGKG